MKWLTASIVLGVAFVSAVPARAENSPATRLSLKGLDGIALRVGPIAPAAQKDGLSPETIRSAVESRLGKAQVSVLTASQQKNELRRPCLTVRIIASKLSTDEYLYAVHVEVNQWVASLGNPAVT